MALLLVGVFDLGKAAILWEQVWSASRSISESASTLAIQPDGSTALTQDQAQQALSLVFAEIPWIANNIETGPRSAVLTSVSYSPSDPTCAAQCSYVAVVEWSKSYQCSSGTVCTVAFKPDPRPCVTLTQVRAGGARSLTSVPTRELSNALQRQNVTQPDPFLIADVHYTFRPWFYNLFTGDIALWASSFWPVRIVQSGTAPPPTSVPWTTYGTATDPITSDPTAVQCS
jgi:hypothetical protein